MSIPAESLLGRKVLDARGGAVGVVLDVGTGERRSPKFLLVAPSGEPQRLLRVEFRDVAELTDDGLRLRASLLPAR